MSSAYTLCIWVVRVVHMSSAYTLANLTGVVSNTCISTVSQLYLNCICNSPVSQAYTLANLTGVVNNTCISTVSQLYLNTGVRHIYQHLCMSSVQVYINRSCEQHLCISTWGVHMSRTDTLCTWVVYMSHSYVLSSVYALLICTCEHHLCISRYIQVVFTIHISIYLLLLFSIFTTPIYHSYLLLIFTAHVLRSAACGGV